MDTTSSTKQFQDYKRLTQEVLIGLLEQRDVEIETQKSEIETQKTIIAEKSRRILELERKIWGRRSEKHLPDNSNWTGSLFDDQWDKESRLVEVEAVPIMEEVHKAAQKRRQEKKAQHKSRKGSSYATYVPQNIERVVTTVYPDNYDEKTKEIIGRDISEHLCLRPSTFFVRATERIICRPKDAKPTDVNTEISEAVLDKQAVDCFADASLLAEIITSKFVYHLPEYRQCARWKELGVNIPTSTVNHWVHLTANALFPLYRLQVKAILQSPYLQVDETSVNVADRKGKTRKGYLWGVRDAMSHKGVFFHWQEGSRAAAVPTKLFKNYQGALQSDGYEAYSRFEEVKGIELLGCMAHIRRKFEALAKDNPPAAYIVKTILEFGISLA